MQFKSKASQPVVDAIRSHLTGPQRHPQCTPTLTEKPPLLGQRDHLVQLPAVTKMVAWFVVCGAEARMWTPRSPPSTAA
jgi:hypothetical protein